MQGSQLSGNLNKDLSNNNRKTEDPSFVLNAIRDSIEGGKFNYQSEPGNSLVVNLPGLKQIGDIYGENNEVYVFHTDGKGNDFIGLFKDDTYSVLVNIDFGFTLDRPIIGTYRLVRGCEKVIYWCDAVRPDRWFNISKPDEFKVGNTFDVRLFSMRPNITPPKIEAIGISNTGGDLPSGMYFIQVELLDKNTTVIFRSNISHGVSIYFDSNNNTYPDINGNYTYPAYSAVNGGKPNAGKSISYNITDLDTKYKYLRINVIRASTGNGFTLEGFTKSDLIPITSTSVGFILSSINDLDLAEDVNKLIVPNAHYYSSEYIKQINDRLVRGGVKEIAKDYSILQRSASKIGTRYKVLEVPAEDSLSLGNPKNPITPYGYMSLLGDEVVAAGIVYVYDDGSEAPPMHIPGICKDFVSVPYTSDCEYCFDVKVTRKIPGTGSCNLYIEYTVNNQNFTQLIENIFLDETPLIFFEQTIYCGPDEVTIDFIEVFDFLNPENISNEYDFEVNEYQNGDCSGQTRCLFLNISPINNEVVGTVSVTVEYSIGGRPVETYTVNNKRNFFTVILCSVEDIEIISLTSDSNFNITAFVDLPPQYEGPNVGPNFHSQTIEKATDWNAEHITKYQLNPDGSFVLGLNGLPIERTLLERWEIYNTALKINANTGYNAYHELSRFKYPDIKACDGEDIWGEDICGNPLVNTPIRHHRLPDRMLEPHYSANGSIIDKELFTIVVTVESEEPPVNPSSILLKIEYDINGNPNFQNVTYFEIGLPQNMIVLEEEPTNIVITILDPGIGNGDPLNVSFEVETTILQTDLSSNKVIRLLGLDFYNIEYPDPTIVGHYFVIGDYENTIISKGYSTPLNKMNTSNREGFDQYIYGMTTGHTAQVKGSRESFISLEYLFEKNYINGDYFKAEKIYKNLTVNNRSAVIDQGNLFSKKTDIALVARDTTVIPDINPNRINTPASEFYGINPQSEHNISNQNTVITNYCFNNKLFTYKGNTTNPLGRFTYGGIKVEKELYTDIFNIKYRRMHTNMYSLDKSNYTVYGGSYYISKMYYFNSLFGGFKPGLLKDLIASILLGALFVVIRLIQMLDPSTAAMDVIRIQDEYLSKYNSLYKSLLNQFRKSLNKSIGFIGDAVDGLFFESRINASLMNESSDPDRELYKGKAPLGYLQRNVTISENNNEGDVYFQARKTSVPEYYYSYNKDYSRMMDLPRLYPLPPFYDYCSECIGDFHNRIIWSPVSLEEDAYDNYRIVLASDFKNFPANKGRIKGISFRGSKMLVHLEQSTFIIPITQQEMRTDLGSVYISSGNFLSLEPVELLDSKIGYAGLQDKLSLNATPYGDVWVDSRKGVYCMFSGQLDILSFKGLHQWFQDNSRLELDKFWSNNGTNLNLSIADKVGIQTTYDPRFNRIILTKKDYRVLIKNFDSEYRLNLETKEIEKATEEGWEIVPLSDKNVYEDLSFTLSYSIEFQGFTSWHSYLPDYMFYNENHFYTNKNGTIYKHMHNNNFQYFYGNKYPYIIEFTKTGISTEVLESLYYVGYSLLWDNNNKTWIDVSDSISFNSIMVYNSDANTGILNLKFLQNNSDYYSNIAYNLGEATVIRTDNNYKISKLYDYTVDKPIITKSWEDIKEVISEYGYIDILPKNINFNIPQIDLSYIRGKFINVRLFFKPEEDIKKIIQLGLLNEKNSMR